jgi:hypothetical protein
MNVVNFHLPIRERRNEHDGRARLQHFKQLAVLDNKHSIPLIYFDPSKKHEVTPPMGPSAGNALADDLHAQPDP